MRKKVIKNTFLILLIPIAITLIICFSYRKKEENVFYDPINHETNNKVIITDNYNYYGDYSIDYYSSDFINYDFLVSNISKNYKPYMYFAVILVLIFSIIYSYVIKNKKW